MNHAVRLSLVLFGLWLALSGYYLALIITLGVLSAVLATVIALRMEIVDHETYPVRVTWRVVSYWGWLIWQIVKANLDVAKRILAPKLPIAPRVVEPAPVVKAAATTVVPAQRKNDEPAPVDIGALNPEELVELAVYVRRQIGENGRNRR